MSAPFSDAEAAAIAGKVLNPEPPSQVSEPETVRKIEQPIAPDERPDEEAPREFSRELIKETIEKNGDLKFGGHTIAFRYHDETEQIMITVSDAESEEIIRQIPPEEYLDFVARFRELFGLLLDETA
jgi:flagellar protein FlaG